MPASNIFSQYAKGQQLADQREQQKLTRQQQLIQLDNQRKGALFQDARTVNSFLKAGQPEQARKVVSHRLGLIEQIGGDPTDTLEIATLLEQGDIQGATNLLDSVEKAGVQNGFLKDLTPKPQKAFKTAEQLERELRVSEGSLDVRREEIKQRQIESGKKKLSSKAEKAIIDSQDAFFKSRESARKMELLASDFQRLSVGGGLSASVSESLKDILGSQDEVTAARKRFNAIRSSQATSNLPPGPASDKDIALALSGFPKENANATQVIGFLKGQAKLARISEKFNEFKAEFISDNDSVKGLIRAWKGQLSDPEFLESIISPTDPLKAIQSSTVGRFQIEVQ
jgi:hypothetical protein